MICLQTLTCSAYCCHSFCFSFTGPIVAIHFGPLPVIVSCCCSILVAFLILSELALVLPLVQTKFPHFGLVQQCQAGKWNTSRPLWVSLQLADHYFTAGLSKTFSFPLSALPSRDFTSSRILWTFSVGTRPALHSGSDPSFTLQVDYWLPLCGS